jgi:hypothetical protein
MKLMYAGLASSPTAKPENYLYNCGRNAACQKEYFVPIRSFADLIFYVEFPFGQPAGIVVNAIDCQGSHEMVFCNYVTAQKPDGTWYGVFTGAQEEEIYGDTFYIEAVFFSNGGQSYKYFSQQFEIVKCDPLAMVKGCYPDGSAPAYSFDCNGVYYGYHAGTGTPQGNIQLRYYHWGLVRKASIKSQAEKLTVSIFRNRRAHRTELTSEANFYFELVPTFYKNHIMAILQRGMIDIQGNEYLLSDSQDFNVIDTDSELWDMPVLLSKTCKQYFGCRESSCTPAPPPCTGNYSSIAIVGNGFSLSGGYLSFGETIDWELYVDEELVDAGNTITNTGVFEYELSPETECYNFYWRKVCNCSIDPYYSTTNSYQFGLCGCCTPIIIDASAEPVPPQQVVLNLETQQLCDRFYSTTPGNYSSLSLYYEKFRLVLPEAYPADIVIDFAAYIEVPSGFFSPAYALGTDLLPAGHYAKARQVLDYSTPFRVTIPAGTTDITTESLQFRSVGSPSYTEAIPCRDNRNPYVYSNQRFFFKVVSPANGLVINFAPITAGYPTTFEQIT